MSVAPRARVVPAALLAALVLLPAAPAAAAPGDERIVGPVRVTGGVRFLPDADAGDPSAPPTVVSGLGPRRFLGTVELLPTPYTSTDELRRMIDMYVGKWSSVPGFVANLTIELFNKQTAA